MRGYCNEMEIYLGKGTLRESKEGGTYFHLIDDMTKVLRHKNHCLCTDNLYSNIPLAKFLYSKSIYYCGTVRSNKKYLPPVVKSAPKWKRGEFKTFQDNDLSNLTSSIWLDTKHVRLISTLSDPSVNQNVIRRVKSNLRNYQAPSSAIWYNKMYSGVDHFDYLRSPRKYGKIGRTSKKLWKVIWHFFVNASITNSWLIYKSQSQRNHGKNFKHFHFRHELALGLIDGFSSRKREYSRPRVEHNANNMDAHRLEHMNSKRPRRCHAHKRFKPNGKDTKTVVTGCRACNIFLCADCSFLFHAQ